MISAGFQGFETTPLQKKNTGLNTNWKLTADPTLSRDIWDQQKSNMKFDRWHNVGIDVMNGTTNILKQVFTRQIMGKQIDAKTKAMEYNYLLGSRMIEYQTVDSQNKKEVALASLATQEKIANTAKQQNVAIAKVKSSGMTDRTRIYAALKVARRGYSSGYPFSSFGT